MVDRWRSLLHATTDVVGADAGNLTRVSGADLEVLLVTGPGRQLYRPGERIRLDGLELQRGRLARAVITPEPANDTTWRRAPDASRGMIAYMGLSLLWPNGNPFGTIDFHYRKPKTPDQVSERFFALIGKLLEDDLARIFADSQRAEIERQRRIEIDRMSFAAAAGGAGVWDFNIDTGALHGDDRWYDILGLDPAHRIETVEAFKRYIHPEDVAAATKIDRARFAELFESGQQYNNFFRIIRPSGEVRWVTSAARLIKMGPNDPVRAVGVTSDITEQHLAQERILQGSASLQRMVESLERAKCSAVASEQAKSALLATVSHDIRTPLSGIVGVLQLLRREPLSSKASELVREALACSDMLTHLLDDVLDLSKLEAGKLELRLEPVDMAEAVGGVIRLLTPEAKAKNIYLTCEIDSELGWAMTDPIRLRQCLFNLIGNAIKFTVEGGVTIRAYALRSGYLRIEVKDTGIGVPAEAKPRILQRFEQASGADRTFGGAGLGLAITRSLAQQMGGDIGFSSRENFGSTFWFEFSAPPVRAPALTKTEAQPDRPLQNVRILLVEDNLRNRQIFLAVLDALGATSMAVGNGYDAIETMREEQFDLVLMDINLPGIDGMEATRRLRALPEPVAANTPVIALTASVMNHECEAYLAAGMSGTIPKPLNPATLLNVINASLINSRAS